MGLRHLLLLLAILYWFYAEVKPDIVDKKIYCGQHLSATLSSVCKGNYNTLNKKAAGEYLQTNSSCYLLFYELHSTNSVILK